MAQFAGPFELGSRIGRGSFGTVYQARSNSGEKLAVKVIDLEEVQEIDEVET